MAKDLQTYLSNRRTRLPRQIAVEAAAQALSDSHNEHGGATFSLYFGNVAGQNLYVVSLFLERSARVRDKTVSARRIELFIADNIDLLVEPRPCIGTWYDDEKKDEVTRVVKILDILVDGTLRVLTGEWLCRQGKRVKMFQQMISMSDAVLFERFTAQAHKSDSVQVTVAPEWQDQGYTMYLVDFIPISQAVRETAEGLVQ